MNVPNLVPKDGLDHPMFLAVSAAKKARRVFWASRPYKKCKCCGQMTNQKDCDPFKEFSLTVAIAKAQSIYGTWQQRQTGKAHAGR